MIFSRKNMLLFIDWFNIILKTATTVKIIIG